jgi:hypothetical protein
MANDPSQEELNRAIDVQNRYQNYLMSKAHVVGVGVGVASVGGEATEEVALIVMVDHKLPVQDLQPADRIPSQLEGVRVDVQETGTLTAFDASIAQ